MNRQLVARLIVHWIFRFVHLVLLFESDIFALIVRILYDKKNDEVEVLSVYSRFQFDSTDVLNESNYLVFYDRTTMFDELCDPEWFIHHITDRYVYFVKVHKIDPDLYEDHISIENCSKLSKFLFENVDKLARMDLDTFQRVAKTLPPYKCKVVMLHSTPCGGGTVAGKLLQACDSSKQSLLVIGEPPILSSLSICYNFMSMEEMKTICRSTLRFLMLHQKTNQTIVLKARPSCTKIVPYIHAGSPSIQHIFVEKGQYEEVISRLVLYTSTQIPVFSVICWLMGQMRFITDSLTSWRLLEEEMIRLVGPKTDVEFSLAQVYGSLVNYKRNKSFFVGPPINIDDLIADTANQVRPILAICDVSDLAIPECIDWKRGAETVLKTIWDTVELTKEDAERVHFLTTSIDQFF